MRRGNLNRKSIILIILSGIFSLVSFALDQSVVQTEDRIRDVNSQYQGAIFNYSMTKSNIKNLNNLSHIIAVKSDNFLVITQFLKEVNFNLNFSKDYVEENFEINNLENKKYLKNLKNIYLYDFINHYRYILDEYKNFKVFFKSITLNSAIYKDEIKKIDTFFNLDFKKHNKIIKSIEVNNKFESIDELKQYSKKMIDLSILFEDSLNPLKAITDEEIKVWNQQKKKILELNKKTLGVKSLRNYLILFSILSQILALIFLLFLFKNILIQLENK